MVSLNTSSRPGYVERLLLIPLALLVLLVGLSVLLSPRDIDLGGSTPTEPTDTAMSESQIVQIDTNLGTIKAKLFTDFAPLTSANFIDLVNQEFYDGVIFHRVIPGFMIQGGDPTGTGSGGRTDKGLPRKNLRDEFHPRLRHDRKGLFSMANRGPNTGDVQFFITLAPTPHLDDRHAVFGEVIEGMDVVEKIAHVPTGPMDRPLDPPQMIRVRMLDEDGETPEDQKKADPKPE